MDAASQARRLYKITASSYYPVVLHLSSEYCSSSELMDRLDALTKTDCEVAG